MALTCIYTRVTRISILCHKFMRECYSIERERDRIYIYIEICKYDIYIYINYIIYSCLEVF